MEIEETKPEFTLVSSFVTKVNHELIKVESHNDPEVTPSMKKAEVSLTRLTDQIIRKYTKDCSELEISNKMTGSSNCENIVIPNKDTHVIDQKRTMLKHMRSAHENNKGVQHSQNENVRYNCEKCGKSFSENGTLNKHIKSIHEDVQYNCEKCDKSFSDKSNLKRHIQSVHENVRYNCEKCDKSYSDKSHLRKHIKSVHQSEPKVTDILKVHMRK